MGCMVENVIWSHGAMASEMNMMNECIYEGRIQSIASMDISLRIRNLLLDAFGRLKCRQLRESTTSIWINNSLLECAATRDKTSSSHKDPNLL
jgi:hypothetical protein